jgi:hypothetical protein
MSGDQAKRLETSTTAAVLGVRFPARDESGDVVKGRAWLLLEDAVDLHRYRVSVPAVFQQEIERAYADGDLRDGQVVVELLARVSPVGEQRFAETMAERLRDLEKDVMATYGGGYGEERDIEIFRHGMKTVCNVVQMIVGGRKIGEPGT